MINVMDHSSSNAVVVVATNASSISSGDISASKYHKLATEYSKMRAQVSVLKKAVLDEQSKAADLKEQLKARDHNLRKSDQEMESLTFRNQQLTRRVAVLQEELDSNQLQTKKGNKGKYKLGFGHESTPTLQTSSPQQLTNHILGEELEQKIEENARLHRQVFELEEEHRRTVGSLHDRVGELEREVNGNHRAIEEVNTKNRLLIERLEQERDSLKVRLQSTEAESKVYRSKAVTCEEQLRIAEENFQTSSLTDTQPTNNLLNSIHDDGDDRAENLTSQINKCLEKIGKLEQSREHWMLEYRLLQMRYEKLQKKVADSERENSPCCSDGSPIDDVGQPTIDSSSTPSKEMFTSLLGKLVFGDENRTNFPNGNSEELRNCLVGRVNELVVHRQLAESKANAFHAELTAVHKRLALAEKIKTAVHEELIVSKANVDNLKEELQTTTNNYKVQLSTMSEHLANMNEKLTSQGDEITDLKFALNNVGNKKNKSK